VKGIATPQQWAYGNERRARARFCGYIACSSDRRLFYTRQAMVYLVLAPQRALSSSNSRPENGLLHCQIQLSSNFGRCTKCHPLLPPVIPSFRHRSLLPTRVVFTMTLPLPPEHQCEETRARLEHFRSLGRLPPNYKPKTLEGLAVAKRYWRR
jgi:hypothetical protein